VPPSWFPRIAVSIARDATTARVLALELLAAQVAVAEAAQAFRETLERAALAGRHWSFRSRVRPI